MTYISGDLRLSKPIAGIMPGIITVAGYREYYEVAMVRVLCGTFACFSYAWLCKVGQFLKGRPRDTITKQHLLINELTSNSRVRSETGNAGRQADQGEAHLSGPLSAIHGLRGTRASCTSRAN